MSAKQWRRHSEAPYPLEGVSPQDYAKQIERIERRHKEILSTAKLYPVKLSKWDGNLDRRRVRVFHGNLRVDCFGTPSTTKRLNIFLSAGGGLLKDGSTPQFPRVSWHPWLDAVNVNIDDPTFAAYPGKLQTGWYVGSKRYGGVATVAATIAKIQEHYGIDNKDVCLIGSSAGGTAALKLAESLSGATAIAENPPIYPSEQSSIKYFTAAGVHLDEAPFRERIDLEHILDHPTSRFLIIQNAEDLRIVEQLSRFLRQAGLPTPGLGLSESGPLSLYFTSIPTLSPHHAFLSVTEFRTILAASHPLVDKNAQAAALDVAHASLRERALSADRISNLRAWSRFLSELDCPELAPPVLPTSDGIMRISLRSHPEVVYRLRLSHQAKSMFIAVDVKEGLVTASTSELEQLAAAAGARFAQTSGGRTISIPRVPMNNAAKQLEAFVVATESLFR